MHKLITNRIGVWLYIRYIRICIDILIIFLLWSQVINRPDLIIMHAYVHTYVPISNCNHTLYLHICDWACENQAYVSAQIYTFRKGWSLCVTSKLCELYMLSYESVNMSDNFHLNTTSMFKVTVNWIWKKISKFASRYKYPIFENLVKYTTVHMYICFV